MFGRGTRLSPKIGHGKIRLMLLMICRPLGAYRTRHYAERVLAGGPLAFTSWWDNRGVAPCYRKFPLALRIRNATRAEILLTNADSTTWLPGDSLFDGSVTVPSMLPPSRWHIDYLLRCAVPTEVWFTVSEKKLEHHWAELLEKAPNFRMPISPFGSSDYHRSRLSHLFHAKRHPSFRWFQQTIRDQSCGSAPPQQFCLAVSICRWL